METHMLSIPSDKDYTTPKDKGFIFYILISYST